MTNKIFNTFTLRNFIKWTIYLLIGAIIIGLILSQIVNSRSTEVPNSVNPENRKLQRLVFASGVVKAEDNETIVSPVTGKIIEQNIKLGDTVEKDKVLFVVEYQNQVGRKVKQEIKSTIAGTVVQLNVSLNQLVTAAQLKMAEISDTSKLIIDAPISEFDITKVKVSQKANLEFTALPGKKYGAAVKFISPAATVSQVDTGVNYSVKLEASENADLKSQLKLGMTVDIEIVTAEKQAKLSLGDEYLFTKDDANYVKVLEGEQLRDQQVEVGFRGETAVEITSGLTTDSKIVLPTAEIRQQRNGLRLFGN